MITQKPFLKKKKKQDLFRIKSKKSLEQLKENRLLYSDYKNDLETIYDYIAHDVK